MGEPGNALPAKSGFPCAGTTKRSAQAHRNAAFMRQPYADFILVHRHPAAVAPRFSISVRGTPALAESTDS